MDKIVNHNLNFRIVNDLNLKIKVKSINCLIYNHLLIGRIELNLIKKLICLVN